MRKIRLVVTAILALVLGLLVACGSAKTSTPVPAGTGSNTPTAGSEPSETPSPSTSSGPTVSTPSPSPPQEENVINVAPTGAITPEDIANYCDGLRCAEELTTLVKKSDDGNYTIVNKSIVVLPDGYPVTITETDENIVFIGKTPKGELVKMTPGQTSDIRVRSGMFVSNEVLRVVPDGNYQTVDYHMNGSTFQPAAIQSWLGSEDRLSQLTFLSEDGTYLVRDNSAVRFANGSTLVFNMSGEKNTVFLGKDGENDTVGKTGENLLDSDTLSINVGVFFSFEG